MFFSKKGKSSTKYFVLLCVALMIIGYYLGYSFSSGNKASEYTITQSSVNFGKMLVQNFFFAVIIIFGAFTFNLLTVCCCLFNGVIFGIYCKTTYINLGLKRTLGLFVPHTIIELCWILLAVSLSYRIYLNFSQYVVKSSRLTRFGVSVLRMRNQFLWVFGLVMVGCLVEYFITYKIFAK